MFSLDAENETDIMLYSIEHITLDDFDCRKREHNEQDDEDEDEDDDDESKR